MGELDRREQSLVALGAALAANCIPCIEYHIPEARKAGLTAAEIEEAVRIADKVRRVPARLVLQTALARVETDHSGSSGDTGSACGCADPGGPGCAG